MIFYKKYLLQLKKIRNAELEINLQNQTIKLLESKALDESEKLLISTLIKKHVC